MPRSTSYAAAAVSCSTAVAGVEGPGDAPATAAPAAGGTSDATRALRETRDQVRSYMHMHMHMHMHMYMCMCM